MEYTSKHKLSMPSYSDKIDIEVLNNNMRIIDGKLKNVNLSDNVLTVDGERLEVNTNHLMPKSGGDFTGDITVKGTAPMYIIEEGSSELYNASYVKYSNGTMIQMFQYYAPNANRQMTPVTFLQPFIAPPCIVGNRDTRATQSTNPRQDLQNHTYEVAFTEVTNTGFKGSSDGEFGASVFVWGRWK